MHSIDRIFEMLYRDNDEETQRLGIEEAKKIKYLGRKIPHTKFVISKMIMSASSARISKLMNDCPLSIYAMLQEFPKNYSGNER